MALADPTENTGSRGSPQARRDLLILCYHGISDQWDGPLGIKQAQFEGQLAELEKRGYRGITFSEAALQHRGGRRVAITFDDAYLSVFEHARVLLEEYGFPATVFVPTAFPGGKGPMAWEGIDQWLQTPHADELLPMSWDQLSELHAIGWEIGSHTVDHPRLTRLAEIDLTRQLAESKATIEAELGARCHSIAYPYGDTNERVAAAAATAGYTCAAALPEGRWRSDDRYQVPRVGIYRADSHSDFERKISPLSRSFRRSRFWPAISRVRLKLLGRG